MTSERLSVVREFLAFAAAKNYAGLTDCLDPDARWYGTRGGLDEQRVARGAEAWIRYLQEIEDPWQRFDFAVEELAEIGDAVVVFLRETGQSRYADLEVQNETAMIFKVADQRIVEMRGYLDRGEAVATASAERRPH